MQTIELIDHNQAVIRQGQELLTRLTNDQYNNIHQDSLSSVGMHIGHVIDHYHCFLDGLESGNINYDIRSRDDQIRSKPSVAKLAFGKISTQLDTIPRLSKHTWEPVTNLIQVVCCTSSTLQDPISISSTLQRELVFLHSHTVHHFALIKHLLSPLGIVMSDLFGVAPSTILHMRSTEANQPRPR